MIDFSENIEQRLMPQLGVTMKMLENFVNDFLVDKGVDISRTQWVVLIKLMKNDGISQHKLACITGRDKAAMARLISTMEKKNLLARIPNKTDKRINNIYITKNGRELFDKYYPLLFEVGQTLENGLSNDELNVMFTCLKKVRTQVGEMHKELVKEK